MFISGEPKATIWTSSAARKFNQLRTITEIETAPATCRAFRHTAAGFRQMEIAMNTHLMLSRRFAPLFWTQFLSAFNDNFLKNTLVFLILATVAADDAGSLVTLAGA